MVIHKVSGEILSIFTTSKQFWKNKSWIEFRNSILYVIFFSANIHLMCLFHKVIIRKYSRAVNLSQFETSLKLSISY